MKTDASKLAFGLAVAFILPAIGFLVGMVWDRMVGGWQVPNIRRGWTTFCLILPIVFLAMMVRFGFYTLRALWLGSPFLFSVIFVFFGVLVPTGLIFVSIHIWRSR